MTRLIRLFLGLFGARQVYAALALLAVALMTLTACGLIPSSPTTIITNTNNNNQGGGGTAPPAPAPAPAPSGPIARVKVTQFGEGNCPPGVQPSGQDRQVRVGCQKFLTCTPFLADGTLAPPSVHGPAPESFKAVVGEGLFVTTTEPAEAFNRDARGKASGVATYVCVVKGVSSPPLGDPDAFNLTVVP